LRDKRLERRGAYGIKTEIWQYERERKKGNDRDGSYGHRE
jgi:hypothetical protein